MSLRTRLVAPIGEELAARLGGFETPVAEASTLAMRDAAEILKARARAAIAGSGLSSRWQKALRVNAYPGRPRTSIDAAAWLYHRIPYAHVMTDGAELRGKPLLWARLPDAPVRMGRGAFADRFTPAAAIDAGIRLMSFRSRKGTPLLGARVRSRPGAKITVNALKRGTAAVRGQVRTVPLFAGLRGARLGRRFSLAQALASARAALPSLYFTHLRT